MNRGLFLISVIWIFFTGCSSLTQGTAGDGSGSRRQELLKEKTRRERSRLMEEIQEIYRNINASFKAQRNAHARDQVKNMEALLQREGLLLSFRREMTEKLNGLKKRYGLPVDTIPGSPLPPVVDVEGLSPEETAQMEKLFALEYQMDTDEYQDVKEPENKVDPRAVQLQKEYQEELDVLYQDGVLFYQQGFYDLAEKVFQELNRIEPGYQDVKKYLQQLDQKNQ